MEDACSDSTLVRSRGFRASAIKSHFRPFMQPGRLWRGTPRLEAACPARCVSGTDSLLLGNFSARTWLDAACWAQYGRAALGFRV